MNDEKKVDIPTAEQLKSELDRLLYRRCFRSTLFNTAASLITAAAAVIIISYFILPVLRVTGDGMEPTLMRDQVVLCNKFADIECGDIIAFYHNKKILLKRVIGSAGDTIEIKEDGSVIRNGEPLSETYIADNDLGVCDIDFPCIVADNHYFVMGDNRAVSVDSRSSAVGCVAEEDVLGRVSFAVFPFTLLEHMG